MENKHNYYDLAQMQSLNLESKINMSIRRIIDWYEYYEGNVFVAISGGKDSKVLAHLCRKIYPDIELVYVDTGLDFISVKNEAYNMANLVLRPKKTFYEIIKEKGYPIISKTVSHNVGIAQNKPDGKLAKRYFTGVMTGSMFDCTRYKWLIDAPFKLSDSCCTYMKKQPSHNYSKITGKKAIVGTMADESMIRYKNWLRNGCNAYNIDNPVSAPLSFWTQQDILEYIKIHNIHIADVYGEIIEKENKLFLSGEQRTGCVFCMFGILQDSERFIRLKKTEEKRYNYIIDGGEFENGLWVPNKNGLGYWFVIDWLNEHGHYNIKY